MHHISRNWFISALSLIFFYGQFLPAQGNVVGAPKVSSNSRTEIPLQGVSTVAKCIAVEAVLLPREPASKLFGGWVARNFAVVKTTISNTCDNQQFILHDIYFDYSDWALSGVYPNLSTPEPAGCPAPAEGTADSSVDGSSPSAPKGENPTQGPGGTDSSTKKDGGASTQKPKAKCLPSDSNSMGSNPGQVATVGALDVQQGSTQDSLLSRRNLVVNGLVLAGTAAGGYAFLGSMDFGRVVSAYNSSFLPGFQKFWPDRRIEQEKNVLSFGYRTDRSTAIAKDDHGSYYAFFPIDVFLLRSDLKTLFLNDPAAFINPAEVLLDIGGNHVGGRLAKTLKGNKVDAESLRNFLLELAQAGGLKPAAALADRDKERALSVQLLLDLTMPCNLEKDGTGDWADPGPQCPYDPKHYHELAVLKRIMVEKNLFAHASLNAVKIVARGVMTVNLDSIPPTIDTVTFDGAADTASYWTVPPPATTQPPAAPVAPAAPSPAPAGGKTAAKPAAPDTPATADAAKPAAATKTLTGIIAGKYLTDGTPAITAITAPDDSKAQLTNYIVDNKVDVVGAKSTDSSMAFTLQLAKTLPPQSKLTFQVSHKTGDATKGTSSQTTSNNFVYTVGYTATPADPTVSKVAMDGDDKTDVWQAKAKLAGTATGTNLKGGTISVSALEIGGNPATAAEYIGPVAGVPDTSTDTSLDFVLPLLQKIADGSTVSFVIKTKVGDTTLTSKPLVYTVKNPVAPAKKVAPPAKKPAPKPPKPATPASK